MTDEARSRGEYGDWSSNRMRKLTRGLDASPAQRLAWLEAMIRLAHASGALPRNRSANGERADRAVKAVR